MQNAIVRHAVFAVIFAAMVCSLLAQEAKTAASETDAAAMASAIRRSYYHPDGMAGFDCATPVDAELILAALESTRYRNSCSVWDALNIRPQGTFGKNPEMTFEWITPPRFPSLRMIPAHISYHYGHATSGNEVASCAVAGVSVEAKSK